MTRWVHVGSSDVLAEGEMIRVMAEDHPVALARVEGKLHAFSALCPHASANLAEGDIRPGWVICPLHGYRYALKNGLCLKPRDGPRLRIFEVEARGNALWVKV